MLWQPITIGVRLPDTAPACNSNPGIVSAQLLDLLHRHPANTTDHSAALPAFQYHPINLIR